MGHVGGMSMSDIHTAIVSLFVTVEIPRNRSLANIVVLIQHPDSAVAFAKPLYIDMKEKDTLAVVSSPHNSIPRRGFCHLVTRS